MSAAPSLLGRRVLVTGIADASSLALPIAEALRADGAELVCTGLGPTRHHVALSAAARTHLESTWKTFESLVGERLAGSSTFALDAGLDASVADLARELAERRLTIDGLVHAIAFDRTIRRGEAKRLIDTTRDEFLECASVSAYSLVALLQAMIASGVLASGAGVVALSYAGAEHVMAHPYRNIGVAKAALERIVRELAAELGPGLRVRVNAIRFSPWAASRAGGAIPGLVDAVADARVRSPLGNADASCLAREVVHLLRPGLAVTGDVRHVDGGYHVLG